MKLETRLIVRKKKKRYIQTQEIAETFLLPIRLVCSCTWQLDYPTFATFILRFNIDSHSLYSISSSILPIHIASQDQNIHNPQTQTNDTNLAASLISGRLPREEDLWA